MEFYTRHLNRMDPWPDELNRAFELANLDLYVTMWGNTEFNATGTLKDFDVSSDLGRIAAPTIMICGEYDEATPAACKDFAAKVPNARIEIIEDASHTGHLEQRETFMAKLRAFLASTRVVARNRKMPSGATMRLRPPLRWKRIGMCG